MTVRQLVVYNEIKKFDDHPWLDIVSKCDLLQESLVLSATDDVDNTDLNLAR
jgi:nucleolar GTP-binding protein